MTTLVDRTFVINFRVVPNKLKYPEIFAFITNKLGLSVTDLKHLQITNSRVFIGTDSPQTAQDIVQDHNMQHQIEQDGKLYRIPLSMEDGSVEVRIHDLRPRINNKQVAIRMREYGEILSIREEVWKDYCPGVPNGVRVLRMKLSKAIPSYISVDTDMTLVTYKGQVATCKHCNRRVHYSQKCSEYAKSLQISVNDRLTMADVVKGSGENTTFVQPPRRDRSSSIKSRGTGSRPPHHNLPKPTPTATWGMSVSSMEPMDQMSIDMPTGVQQSQTTQGVGGESAVAGSDISKKNFEDRDISPPLRGFDEQTSSGHNRTADNNTNNRQSTANVKRPGSPLSADNENAEKKPTQSPRQSRSRTKQQKH